MLDDHVGPVDYVVVEFEDTAVVRRGFERLLQLVDAGRIRVLDLEFVTNEACGPRTLPLDHFGPAFAEFGGAYSGLLDADDLATVSAALAPGGSAAVLVYEELSFLEVIADWEGAGAKIVAEGPVDLDDLGIALEGI